jgi:homoserine O-succinyltransferase/O-acetyltransferase
MRIERFTLGSGPHAGRPALKIGLVNNMPDQALRATELQFARMLKDAACKTSAAMDVQLQLFCLPQMARSEAGRARMEGFYADAAGIAQAGLDALIVTGAEPHEGDLRCEPYWGALARLIDWTQQNTISTIFSCLAAHAAVLHLDGIERIALPQKLSGIVPCERVREDSLLAGLAPVNAVPHSRRHGLSEEALAARGYRVLSRIPYGDPEVFTRQGKSLLVFLQGRAEYDADSLAREYLHDTGRFLRRESSERPAMPENYFDRATEDTLFDLSAHAVDAAILPRYRDIVGGALKLPSWRDGAVRFYANWLSHIAAEKTRRTVIPITAGRRRA